MAMSKSFRILEKSKPPSPYSILLEHRNKNTTLLFESQAVAVLSTSETEIIRKQYTKIHDAYGCLGVIQLNAGESSVLLYLVIVVGCFSVGKIGDVEVFRITQTQFIPLQYQQQANDDKISEVRKVLNSGTFYFVWSGSVQAYGGIQMVNFELTLCAQRRRKTIETDNRFFWNRMLFTHLLRYGVDTNCWLLKIMCGSVEIRTVYAGSRQARAAIISRLSCERAGTRFNVRGTNDEGYVANFVETEQVIYVDSDCTSYVQIRGSVPLHWEQPGVQVGSHKVKLSRGFEASRPSFNRHMSMMKTRYGRQAIVNLLSTSLIGSKEGEAMLSNEFQRHHRESVQFAAIDVPHIVFDYHQECRGSSQQQTASLGKLKMRLDTVCPGSFGIFRATGDEIHQEQTGVIRTNCLDCLDRTNCVQTFFGLDVLTEQVRLLGFVDKKQSGVRFEEVFRQMWINNGNEVSKIYAGTGAIQGGSKLMDGARSAARTIQNNLLDNSKQEAIDILLVGSTLSSELADRARILLPTNMLHAPTPVLRETCKRYREFVDHKMVRIACGTYNVNGGKHFRSVVYKDVSLADWLLDSARLSKSLSLVNLSHPDHNDNVPIDIVAIGFQEIVDLNASNIVAASSDNAREWAEELERTLSRDHPYVLLTYQQLVGVCLYVFIRPEHAQHIRDVAVDCVKTGLGGATGNKGATAVRFVLNGTSFCFVCAHFAAGQQQVAERNADFAEICRKITFPMGRTLKSNDYVFFCGDFNYRIDMDKDELRELIKENAFGQILPYDQLIQQKDAGNVFSDFSEGTITFPPTYKYDLFSDDYDTSEKNRAPAWTDRVLWRRRKPPQNSSDSSDRTLANWNVGRLLHYGRAELKQSDHRPVIAIIDVEIAKIVPQRRSRVFHDVIKDLGPPDCTIIIEINGGDGVTRDSALTASISTANDVDNEVDNDVDSRLSSADNVVGDYYNDNGITSDYLPPLPTTTISGEGSCSAISCEVIYDENLMAALLQELTQIGDITLVRYVGETMWITFRDGQSALTAVQKQSIHVCGHHLTFKLKTPHWLAVVEREIDLCSSNTIQLYDQDAMVPSILADYNSIGIPEVSQQHHRKNTNTTDTSDGVSNISNSGKIVLSHINHALHKPPPPNRPPLPKSPNSSPRYVPAVVSDISPVAKTSVIKALPDMLVQKTIKPSNASSNNNINQSNTAIQQPLMDYIGAIYEEINDDINIPKPLEPPPPLPLSLILKQHHQQYLQQHRSEAVYDLDVSTVSSKLKTTTIAKSLHQQEKSLQSLPPPPLPVRRGCGPPPVPNRSGIPPPLPARPPSSSALLLSSSILDGATASGQFQQ